ncbi:RNA polymerase sigma-I factor [Clostridium sp. BSD9I1]|uniref:RNA polymerase sigma-I factor n=1 Tax=Clostridium sp. BSD9I1 TaxID=2003589 RepID=UPI001648B738|nr:RNA polymerase sigma-I factor [Clostridium sp. BSD9I1]
MDNINPSEVKDKNKLIEENKNFIYGCTYKICKRILHWENDDELSIAMIAFNKALDTYNHTKGNFHSYAKVLINNSIIDFFRKDKNNSLLVFDNNEESFTYIDYKNSINQYEIQKESEQRIDEINALKNELANFKLTFTDLINHSPKHIDTRSHLLNIALCCTKNDDISTYIRKNKALPIKQITVLTGCNRKLLERWRKYIIVLFLIMSNDEYLYLKSYLNIGVGDKNE